MEDKSKYKILLKVLVDKRISDLPNNFTESHEVAISMQLKDDSTFNDDKHFSIVIDAVDAVLPLLDVTWIPRHLEEPVGLKSSSDKSQHSSSA